MGDSYLESSNLGRDLIRSIFAFLDRPAYWLLGIAYQLFFNVASADIFSNNTIMKFYGRVQVILGVFMMFQLAMVFLRGIIDPDSFTGAKDGKGGGTFLKRVAMSLILITLLMPISITSPRNEYEKQINNNGLLFGTLYSLQHRILSNNTIGRLVLGTTDTSANYVDGDEDKLETSSRVFSSTILKAFYRINLLPKDKRTDTGTKDPATLNKNRVCQDMDSEFLNSYTKLDADPGDIIAMVNKTCTLDDGLFGSKFLGSKKYYFTYMPLISTIVAIIFVFILLSFTIDIAVRAIKLAVLRLIAPIPLISYMDPKGSGDEAFKSWSKTLTSTYLDLFIRLAVVYFVIFIIQDMIVNGIVIEHGSGVIGVLSLIIIWIGLFVFAKQAPKFIKQVLGLKDSNFNLFGGFAAMAGAGALAAGTLGSFNASRTASRFSDITNNKNPDSLMNRGKHLLAGFAGAAGGAVTGMTAWAGAKDHQGKAVMDAINKRNATEISRGASGSTLMGRMSATGHRLFQGEGATGFDKDTREIAQKKSISNSAKDLFSYLEGKGKTDGADYKVKTAGIEALGGDKVTGSLNEFNRLKAAALAEERRTGKAADFTFSGHTINAHDAVATKIEEELSYAAGDEWAFRQEAGNLNSIRMDQLLPGIKEQIIKAHPEWNTGREDDIRKINEESKAIAKDTIVQELDTKIRTLHKDDGWTEEQFNNELARYSSSFGKTDNGYAQKRDTYNESLNAASDPNNTGLYTRYEYSGDEGNLGGSFYATKLKKTSKAAGGEAGRLESSDAYKKKQADFNATKK